MQRVTKDTLKGMTLLAQIVNYNIKRESEDLERTWKEYVWWEQKRQKSMNHIWLRVITKP